MSYRARRRLSRDAGAIRLTKRRAASYCEPVTDKKTRRQARRPTELRPEFVALGLLAEGPAHGYELFRRFKDSLGEVWHIGESQFYALLKRIEVRGMAIPVAAESGSRAVGPRVLKLSPEGKELFDAWLREPTVSSSRLLHLEFLARLYFLARLSPREAADAAAAQAKVLSGDIARLDREEGSSGTRSRAGSVAENAAFHAVETLSAAFRLSQLRAALAWIEESVMPAAAAAFSGSSRA